MNADFEKLGRILVRAVNWVGDTILTYPAVQRQLEATGSKLWAQ